MEGFIERVDSLAPEESFDVVTYDWGYFLNETALAFFEESRPDSRFPSVADLQALEDRHPDKRVIYWTTQFARLGMPDLITFNERMRHYAQANGKILFDMADIESHRPDGTPCTGLDDDKNPVEVPALCDEYTDEVIGGHLNALGRLQGAKAFWVLMARLAGWNPQS